MLHAHCCQRDPILRQASPSIVAHRQTCQVWPAVEPDRQHVLARRRIAEQRALALMMSAGTKREIALAAVEHLVILAHETAEKSAACDVADAEVNFVEREMEQAEQAA